MDELIHRQFSIMRQALESYKANQMSLNSLIQRIQGIGAVIEIEKWGDAVFPIILEMEQINADVLNAGTKLTEADNVDLKKLLLEVEGLIDCFEKQ